MTIFLSTPSARRATQPLLCHGAGEHNFYPRPPRGGRPGFSGHLHCCRKFLSTPSARRATPCTTNHRSLCVISIHALREEGDPSPGMVCLYAVIFLSTPSARRATPCCCTPQTVWSDFYPRPPRGGRPSPLHLHFIFLLFLSTPSARRATDGVISVHATVSISIHALREEGDSKNRDKISIFL